MDVQLLINGLHVDAHYEDATVQGVFLPLLECLSARQKALGRRLIAFLAAPPATGKSTLCTFLESLSQQRPPLVALQALGMDGFHYHQDYILTHSVLRDGQEIPMQLIKGAPETFDAEKLAQALRLLQRQDLRWPIYDRRIHDVVEDALPVSAPIALVEGNWLLLDDPRWSALPRDVTIFIHAEETLLRDRLIDRKMAGGFSREEATAHYLRSDALNVRRCLNESMPADIVLEMTVEGDYRVQSWNF